MSNSIIQFNFCQQQCDGRNWQNWAAKKPASLPKKPWSAFQRILQIPKEPAKEPTQQIQENQPQESQHSTEQEIDTEVSSSNTINYIPGNIKISYQLGKI